MRAVLSLALLSLLPSCLSTGSASPGQGVRLGLVTGLAASYAEADIANLAKTEVRQSAPIIGGTLAFELLQFLELGLRGTFLGSEAEETLATGLGNISAEGEVTRAELDGLARLYLGEGATRGFLQGTVGGGSIDFSRTNLDSSFARVAVDAGLIHRISAPVSVEGGIEFGYSTWEVDVGAINVEFDDVDFRLLIGVSLHL